MQQMACRTETHFDTNFTSGWKGIGKKIDRFEGFLFLKMGIFRAVIDIGCGDGDSGTLCVGQQSVFDQKIRTRTGDFIAFEQLFGFAFFVK